MFILHFIGMIIGRYRVSLREQTFKSNATHIKLLPNYSTGMIGIHPPEIDPGIYTGLGKESHDRQVLFLAIVLEIDHLILAKLCTVQTRCKEIDAGNAY